MAQVQSRKSNFYSQKQSIRDELSAPLYLESAGDVLIKHLARKQANTRTSLREQLEIVQHFEKGFELSPDNRKGVTPLEKFKKTDADDDDDDDQSDASAPAKRQPIRDLDELMRVTGLTRHELELGLSEKPNSAVSQLYMFAIGNKRQIPKSDTFAGRWSEHPMNRLKEIEEECFGRTKTETQPAKRQKKEERKNKRRKRKRKARKESPGKHTPEPEPPRAPVPHEEKQPPRAPAPHEEEKQPPRTVHPPRPSLWDVKDMKKWSETKQIGCRPPALYTIKDGQIIKLGVGGGEREDVT